MARKRIISPPFFTHRALYAAEVQYRLPLRVSFSGLWGHADRRGVFEWKPDTLQHAILPFDPVDFGAVLEALARSKFIYRYVVDRRAYGWIPTLRDWQTFHVNERPSNAPSPPAELLALYQQDLDAKYLRNGFGGPGTTNGGGDTLPASTPADASTVLESPSHSAGTSPAPPQDGASTPVTVTVTGTVTSTDNLQQQQQLMADGASAPRRATASKGTRRSAASTPSPKPEASHAARAVARVAPAVASRARSTSDAGHTGESAATPADVPSPEERSATDVVADGRAGVAAIDDALPPAFPAKTLADAARLPLTDTAESAAYPKLGVFVPFPDFEAIAQTQPHHPRLVGRRHQTAPGEPPVVLDDEKWQLDVLYERWRLYLGEVEFGLFRKKVEPAQQVYSFTDLWRAIVAFHELREWGPERDRAFMTITRFPERISEAVRLGAMPYTLEHGRKSERGARALAHL